MRAPTTSSWLSTLALGAVSLGAASLSGCVPDLGECDEADARRVAFIDPDDRITNGLPLFEGQALVAMNCASGGFCHTADASAENRRGAPAGLDFNVLTACDERGLNSVCRDEDIERLRVDQRKTHNHRHSIFAQVRDGDMPPGARGREVVDGAPRVFRDDGTPLPAIDSSEGRRILQNWLSCGSPVVEATRDPQLDPTMSPTAPGDLCDPGLIGDCVVGQTLTQVPPDPRWSDIYDTIIGPFCGESCHSEALPDQLMLSQLDLSTAEMAYGSMVGIPAFGSECSAMGTQIVPMDPDGSLLIQKLEEGDAICGDRMPVGGPFMPQNFIDAVRTWIAAGAVDDTAG